MSSVPRDRCLGVLEGGADALRRFATARTAESVESLEGGRLSQSDPRLAVALDVARILATTGELEAALARTIPLFAVEGSIDAVDQHGRFKNVVRASNGSESRLSPVVLSWSRELLTSKRPEIYTSPAGVIMSVALWSHGTALGVWTFAPSRELSEDDVAAVELIATELALALDRASLGHTMRAAIDARDRLLAYGAHDLRGALNAVVVQASLLLLPEDRHPEHRKRVDSMMRICSRMDRLVADLLDVVAAERGELRIDRRACSLKALIEDVVDAYSDVAHARAITLVVPEHVPNIEISCDRGRIHQVLANLLSNSLKFTPQNGSVSLDARLSVDSVCLSVSDTGPGIDREQFPHIFEPFWQGAHRQGMGLGLAIARAIVEMHRGSIEVESETGSGATFRFTLPLR